MSYKFQAGRMYRMPTHFGPAMGPRQGPDGRKFECKDNPKTTALAVSFLTNGQQLEALLPERFTVAGEPVVTVHASYMTEIEWLAGRGYNVLGVSFPATFSGEQDRVTGSFLSILWENLTDPILTGREELGFAKLYCELPEPNVLAGHWHATASWLGFRFLDLKISQLRQQSSAEINSLGQNDPSAGQLHYKYIPRTGEWGAADVAYACLSPVGHSNRVIQQRWLGEGSVQFHPPRWEDMPTQYNIVNAFHVLEIKEMRGASITKSIGGEDLSAQQILR